MVESGSQRVVADMKQWQFPVIGFLVQLLVKLRVHPNVLTVLAFAAGLAALKFLFVRLDLFVLFAAIHVLFDILDGAVARATHTSELGSYLDYISDRAIEFGLLAKTYIVFGDSLALAALGVFIVHHLLHIASKRLLPVIYMRTTLLIIYALGFYELAGIIIGSILGYGVFLQIGSFFTKK